ncbi:MAG: NADPH-dependent FMN reductase [Methanomicrobiales archaeon 53_19]|uniref:flavodoxin family protein n=1 Tax=Methanocalculus sp. TaxID=2004547 RepID=UPI000749AAD8|nr:flavodoxin family protein [Methanocalculus sp.]KUK71309.1 MAG: NADPH-dependent FMN reductase [Methanocalculus sp. 52_23]KUL04882.1 MAG: NADPH-dependent FMN reductase [Methanomicrobiales archaeon 53_19]HIJ06130.1 flavodoxin family protein [Methanocalculus sp.]
MARVVLINASPRTGGNTECALEECKKALHAEGIETEDISLRGRQITSCIACYTCTKTGRCAIDDGVNEMIETIRSADGLIVGTPVYFGTARGELISALQRIGMVSRGNDQFLSRMVGGPIAVARRGGHTATIQELLMFYLINDMIVCGSTYWNIAFGKEKGEVQDDAEGMDTVRRFGENVGFCINQLKK